MNLIMTCTDALDQPATPVCTTDYGERITTLVFSKDPITKVGDQPSAAEFNNAHTAGLCTVIYGVSGSRTLIGEDEVDILYKEWFDKKYTVSGKILTVSESIQRLTEKLNAYKSLYFYYITDKNYCFGGCQTNPEFTVVQNNTAMYIQYKLDHFTGIDYANHDANYFDVVDLITVTVDRTDITMDSTSITADRI